MAYYLVMKNGGESLQERSPVRPVLSPLPIEYTSVKFGIENYVSPWIQSEDVEEVSKECRYVDSSRNSPETMQHSIVVLKTGTI